MNKETTLSKAKALTAFLATHGLHLKHSAALEAIARIEGAPSYNVLQSTFSTAAAPLGPLQSPAGKNDEAARPPLRTVDVCRIGYGHATVYANELSTRKEAEAMALAQAGDIEFSEKDSEYCLAGNEPSNSMKETAEVTASRVTALPEEELRRKWVVNICRISFGVRSIDVCNAVSQDDANERALDEAGNHYYSTHASEYEVTGGSPA